LIDGAGDVGQSAGYGLGYGGVFGIDELGDCEGRFAIEIVGGVVGLLGAEAAEWGWFQVGAFRNWRVHFNWWSGKVPKGAKGHSLFHPLSARLKEVAEKLAEYQRSMPQALKRGLVFCDLRHEGRALPEPGSTPNFSASKAAPFQNEFKLRHYQLVLDK
jgi:hypothetical protein